MATRLLRRLRWRVTGPLGLVAGVGLCLGVLAPAAGGVAAPARPSRGSLHPDYSLRQQR